MHIVGKEEADALAKVIAGKQFMRYRGGEGGFTEQFEADLREKIGVRHALTVNSGTSAIICGLVGMGVGPGDEVIVPGYTFIATALAVLATGAVPVIAEIDESLTLDPDDVDKKITPHTRAIIPVHMLNLPADLERLGAVADRYGVPIMEDACQAVGVPYRGRCLGAVGRAGAFSFNQFKNITCGEGGAVLTNDDEVYERALLFHDGGAYTRQYASDVTLPFYPGFNFRVCELQGAMLGVQLGRLDGIIRGLQERRKVLAEILSQADDFRLVPHHDEENAAGLCIIFDEREGADRFARAGSRNSLLETGRHVYTNWKPIMEQNLAHPRMNPYAWAKREIRYTDDMCPDTLDILGRAFRIGFDFNAPIDEVRRMGEELLVSGKLTVES